MPEERGKALFEAIRKDYATTYAYKICEFLQNLDPETFSREFGSMDNCVKTVQSASYEWFEKWLPNYVIGVTSRVKAHTAK